MKMALTLSCILAIVGGGVAIVHYQLYLPEECRGAPKSVPFRQGMTLCPGQKLDATPALAHYRHPEMWSGPDVTPSRSR